MKELSIEEKYEMALGRARELYMSLKEHQDWVASYHAIENIFPELREESEDERIRKELIKFVKVNIPNEERYIAWLEKQGEPTDINPSEFDLHLNKLLKQFETLPKEELASSLSFYLNVVQNDGTYREEKQGEQKPQGKSALEAIKEEKVDNANKVEPKDYNGIDPYFGKPVDKVEPKFLNGQWIVWHGKCYTVYDNSCGYELLDQDGFITSLEYGTVEVNAHRWTIDDAKDGDVLADNIGVILFKSIRDNNVINYYAYLSGLFAIQKGEEYWGYAVNCALSPATKEQRERFFAAMHEAGYEWNAEKKELKKISQRMISAEAKEAMYGKPTAWSEEDSIRLQRIIDFLWYNRKGDTDTIYQQEQDIDWLKSLKDRVHPQPKQGWSEADNMRSTSTMQVLEYAKSIPDYNQFGIDDINKNIDWLKSLRPQPNQEWSEEDKKMSRFIGNAITADDSSVYLKNKGIEVIDAHVWLNELKYRVQPQNQWKPSDEQMEVLKALVEDNNQRYFYTTLNSLYEQLKKL